MTATTVIRLPLNFCDEIVRPTPEQAEQNAAQSAHAATGERAQRLDQLDGQDEAPLSDFVCDAVAETDDPETVETSTAPSPLDGAGASPNLVPLSMTVNGERIAILVDPRMSLFDVLNERLGLMRSNRGCASGLHDACTVLVHGRELRSCTALAVAHDGSHVTTLRDDPAQQPFARSARRDGIVLHDAFRYGYCTSGDVLRSAF